MANKASKKERLELARKLMIQHGTWGSERINKIVKDRLGAGLRAIDIAHLKAEVLIGQAKVHTGRKAISTIISEGLLSADMAARPGFAVAHHRLVSAGYTPGEIKVIFAAPNVPALFDTDIFKRMLQNRRTWVRTQRQRGLTITELRDLIRQYYQRPSASPFEFLRVEYQSRKRVDFKDYREAARIRAARQTRRLYNPVVVEG